jgi:pimeloyl-ACP methyl ester carboxylesterase
MNKKIIVKSFCAVLFIFGFQQFSVAFPGDKNLTIKPYVFENSKKEKVEAELGRLKVPENRKKKNGKMIELAFVRFKSTSKNPGFPIIYLAGGPGGSGIQSAKYGRFPLFMAMREFGDVIALDQRGTGDSKPNLSCQNKIDLPFDKPLTRENLIKEESEKLKTCAAEFEKNGVDVSAYHTLENASDLNDLREALGVRKISLWGISYGTHLTLVTIRKYGQYIDKAILAGVEGVDDTYKLPKYTQDLMVDLDKRLKEDPELSKVIPDFLGLVKTVHQRLEKEPVVVELTDPKTEQKFNITLGKYDLQYLFSAFSGSNEAQALYPKLYYDMSNGDFTFLAQQIARYRKGNASSVMSIAMDCASGLSQKRQVQIQTEMPNALFSNAINDPFPEICNSVNYTKVDKSFYKPVKSDVPVLFISGTLDGRTPVSNAEIAAKGFLNISHLIIDGAGHSDPLFLSSPKILETMQNFMSGNKLAAKINIEMSKPFMFQPISTSMKNN